MSGVDGLTVAGLSAAEISGGYGDTIVLRNITLSVSPGEVLGVVGRNGVGKTTLMRLLSGFLPLASGVVRWRDSDLKAVVAHQRQSMGITYAPQEGVVFDNLSVRENLDLRRRAGTRLDPLLEIFPRLRERLQQKAGTLSGGEKKLVSFARAVAEDGDLTLLDEPTEGVQQENINLMATLVRQRRLAGASFVIAEQNLSFLEALADRVLVLDHGVQVYGGVLPSRDVLEAFLEV